MAKILAAALSALVTASADDYMVGQCAVQPSTKYQNCWGDDLEWEAAESFEECCEKCANIPKCEFFTYDVWNHDGKQQNYCFFKYGCQNPVPSSTAMSGHLRPSSTTSANTTTSPTTTTSTTTNAPTTGTTTPASTSTSAATTVTTTAPADQPQCGKPHTVSSMGGVSGQQLNVSSKEACCASCHAPACSYVTFGKYAASEEEVWACFLHDSKPSVRSSLDHAGAFLTLYGDEEQASCDALGLTGCVGADVIPFAPPSPRLPVAGLCASGAAAFFVSLPVGYWVAKRLNLAGK